MRNFLQKLQQASLFNMLLNMNGQGQLCTTGLYQQQIVTIR